MRNALIFANIILMGMGTMAIIHRAKECEAEPIVIGLPYVPITQKPEIKPINPEISNSFPSYLNYVNTVKQLKEWQDEAPELVEVGTYGRSTRNQDLYYIRIRNKRIMGLQPRVLITACIHGNEPLSASTTMAMIGTILKEYGDNEEVTRLIDSRDIYFIPVVSPDSYPHSRHVDGVDPNRNFPGPSSPNIRSVAPVAALRDLFLQINPQAVISGHTWGRVFLIPYGDTNVKNHNWDDYKRIVGQMCDMSGYKMLRAYDLYTNNGLAIPQPIRAEYRPIYGSEVDWYYRNGAFASSQFGQIHSGAFSIVMEMGTHQRIPTMQEIRTEFDMTFRGVLYFIKEAPLVEIWWDSAGRPVNRDGTPKKTALRTAVGDYTTVCNARSTSRFTTTDMASFDSVPYRSLDIGIWTDSRRNWKSLLLPELIGSTAAWNTESIPFGLTNYLRRRDQNLTVPQR
jgi:hypothetical protein